MPKRNAAIDRAGTLTLAEAAEIVELFGSCTVVGECMTDADVRHDIIEWLGMGNPECRLGHWFSLQLDREERDLNYCRGWRTWLAGIRRRLNRAGFVVARRAG